MVEVTLEGGSKGGGKEELGNGEWISLNTLSLRKTKIWQDYLTLLKLKRGEKNEVFFFLEWRKEGGLYSSGGRNMNERSLNKG